MSEDSKKIITDKSKIVQLLMEQCLLQETFELFVNKDERLFYSHILNKLPDNIGEEAPNEFAGSYASYTYTLESKSILIEPPVSDNGNVPLKEGDRILLRFFTGHNAFETVVPFERFVMFNDRPCAAQLGFPSQLIVLHTRKQLRVTVLADSGVKVNVITPDIGNFKPCLKEMSINGLSICMPGSLSKELSVGSKVKLTINVHDEDEDFVACLQVRHFTPCPTMECCSRKDGCNAEFGTDKAVLGADFEALDRAQELQVNEILYFIQRERLITEKEELIRFNKELEKQVIDKTNQLRENDIGLLERNSVVGLAVLASGVVNDIANPIQSVKSLLKYVEKSMNKVVETTKYWDDETLPAPNLHDFKEFLEQINFNSLINSIDSKFASIKNGLERVAKVVNNLKSLAQNKERYVSKIDINKSIKDAVDILSGAENLEFGLELQKTPTVECFANEINHSILHVIQNAAYAVENNGIIRISSLYDKKEDEVVVKVIDNGTGMSPDVLKQVFNPFFTTKPLGAGTGMGLSIIKRVIKRHDGKIDITSRLDLGTTVTITLPVRFNQVDQL
ncbi:MAG: ATP-binding protein [Candidatus Anammoxibacter sp.]